MGKVQHTVTGCVPVDRSALEAYLALITTNRNVTNAEEDRVEAEAARVLAENARVETEDSRVEVESARVEAEAARVLAENARVEAETARETQAGSDHTRAEVDHEVAVDDHTQAGEDHAASSAATDRANEAAAAAEHMVDIKRGPKGDQGNTGSSVDYPYELVNNLTTEDATKGLSAQMGVTLDGKISQLGQYEDNPEFVEVHTDADGKVLYGVKSDGDFYIGAGVPSQIDAAIDEKLAEGLETKVDKEEGMSLIDADYAASKSTIENHEYIEVTTDSEDKVLEGVKTDGTKVIGGNLEVGGSATIGGDTKILGNLEVSGVLYKVIENPEYLAAWVDAEDKVIFGLQADGKTYVGDAYFLNEIKNNQEAIEEIQTTLASISSTIEPLDIDALSSITAVENHEYIEATTDSEGKILAGRTPDGAAFESVGFTTPKVSIDGATLSNFNDPEGRIEIKTDSEDKIMSYRDEDGVLHESVGIETNSVETNHLGLSADGMTEFQQALKDSGFNPGCAGDWSDYISNKGKNPLHLSVPRLAYINLTNASGDLSWPISKSDDLEAIMEFNDMQGNYFKKNIIFNAQGNSSMSFIKKNGSIKMFDGSIYNSKGKKGKGDKFGVKFGDWVPQSTYHIKAYYTDFFKGVSWISYQIAIEVANTRGIFKDRTWKQGLFKDYTFTDNQFENPQINDMNLQIDNGALCQPDGFPCIVYLNGEFYGIYVWLIKKDAANFNMEDKAEHIHLDGRLDNSSIFNANGNAANMNWNPVSDSGFEVRNPENLITIEGEEYDADIDKSQELAGIRTLNEVIPTWDSTTSYAKGVIVGSNNRVYLSKVNNNVGNNPDNAKSTDHTKALDKATDFWIDVTFDNKVKTYILELSAYGTRVNSAPTTQDKKEQFEQYFDIDNLIDYNLVQMAVADSDGFSKNWQWTTWDGVKWFVNNYDKDCSFGNDFTGMFTNSAPTERTGWSGQWSWMLPFLHDNYDTELRDRWKYLVECGIFTKEYMVKLFKEWTQRVGSINYNKEYTKWNESPCNRDSGVNDEYWKIDSFNYTTSPQTTYNPSAIYNAGDSCIVAVSQYEVTFICKKTCQGENPIIKTYTNHPTTLGYRDNLWRLAKFVEKNLEAINTFVNS